MNWYWKVRIYDSAGGYWHAEVKTIRDLNEINTIQDFYKELTGCKMLLEGMSDKTNPHIATIKQAFEGLWLSEADSVSRPNHGSGE
jgi:hypothetical protein